MVDAQHLPQGRRQAGDRHLNFHETRDNLEWLIGHGYTAHFDLIGPTGDSAFHLLRLERGSPVAITIPGKAGERIDLVALAEEAVRALLAQIKSPPG